MLAAARVLRYSASRSIGGSGRDAPATLATYRRRGVVTRKVRLVRPPGSGSARQGVPARVPSAAIRPSAGSGSTRAPSPTRTYWCEC